MTLMCYKREHLTRMHLSYSALACSHQLHLLRQQILSFDHLLLYFLKLRLILHALSLPLPSLSESNLVDLTAALKGFQDILVFTAESTLGGCSDIL